MNQEMAPLNKTEGDADENNQPQVADNPWSKKLPKAYFGMTNEKWIFITGVFGLATVIIGMIVLVPFGNKVDTDVGFNPIEGSLTALLLGVEATLEVIYVDQAKFTAGIMTQVEYYAPEVIKKSGITALVLVTYCASLMTVYGTLAIKYGSEFSASLPSVISSKKFIQTNLLVTQILLMIVICYWFVFGWILIATYFWIGADSHGAGALFGNLICFAIWIYLWNGVRIARGLVSRNQVPPA
jgi:hypothetical protein